MSSKREEPFRFRITAQDRPYDCHRPKGCTLLAIEVEAWPGNEFCLWLPETIYADGETVWANWTNGLHQDFQVDAGGAWRWSFEAERFRFQAALVPDPANGVLRYRYEFTNTSDRPLTKLNTQTCFHLANAPQFISIRGERLWACLDGEWKTTDRIPRHLSIDPRRVAFLRAGVRSERTVVQNPGFPSAVMAEAAHHPLVIAENFGATASVGIASANYERVFNNNDPILRCIHSEPAPVAALAPGAVAAQEAIILFCHGDHSALLRKHEELKSTHPGRTR